MSGKGLQSLLKKLSDILRLPVLLLDQHTKLLSSSHRIPIDTSVLKNICYSLPGLISPAFPCCLTERRILSFRF